jgi:hypothetical protein
MRFAFAPSGIVRRRLNMLWAIIVILLILWLLGLISNVVGPLIWILLVAAIIVLLYQLLTGRRAV